MSRHRLLFLSFAFSLFLLWRYQKNNTFSTVTVHSDLPQFCKTLRTLAGRSSSYSPSSRVPSGSDRFFDGTPPVLIRDAKILTGDLDPYSSNGTDPDTLHGSILLDKGLIIRVGTIPPELLEDVKRRNKEEHGLDLVEVDAGGKWITPGLVDLHSHIGVQALPILKGASDGNSRHQPINPFLRSVDGINTHDLSYYLTPAGGVTTAQVLPGSANNIGGQAFLIKMRQTEEKSVRQMVLEPPRGLFGFRNDTRSEEEDYVPWRHMKHACGENPDRLYSQTRMDAAWNFRDAYSRAQKLLHAQDEFCVRLESQVSARTWGSWFGSSKQAMESFPEDLELEALVDVLRGRVKLSVHCYEAVDLDAMVRLTNEFHFPIASFHHAGETYLVPELLKKAWGGPPAAAIFASNARKKREAYRGSEFAPRILADAGIDVVMKSDHPVLPSRHLLYEAQQAFYYGLQPGLAIASVTSTPADRAGVGWRVGRIGVGYDADLVLWDTHPLALGATPVQVWIDQIPQLPFASDPFAHTDSTGTSSASDPEDNGQPHVITNKPSRFQELPKVPDWTKERKEVVKWDGEPPLEGWSSGSREEGGMGKMGGSGRGGKKRVRFIGVRSMWVRTSVRGDTVDAGSYTSGIEEGVGGELKALFDESDDIESLSDQTPPITWTVLVEDGRVICYEPDNLNKESSIARLTKKKHHHVPCTISSLGTSTTEIVNLFSGSLSPGFTSFGSPLGLVEIRLEPSTNDGDVWDPLTDGDPPGIFGTGIPSGGESGEASLNRARDGLFFGGRNTLLAYRAGVTKSITPPSGKNSGKFLLGLSVAFHTGALNAFDVNGGDEGGEGGEGEGEKAVIKDEVGLHVAMGHDMNVGVSTQIGMLREMISGGRGSWEEVRNGELPLIIHVDNVDIMATLIKLKYDIEMDSHSNARIRMTFAGASEAHILADEIARAGIAVILTPSRPFPRSWDARRILPGPPLSSETAITKLVKAGVLVGIGVPDEYDARNLRFELGWAALDSNGTLSKTQVLALGTVNLERALGLLPSDSYSGPRVEDFEGADSDFVIYQGGGPFDMESKIIGVISGKRKVVELFS
ncbi:hypothetical protein K435DRAFT_966103 [Dendrothele bispora CBS 962.96]|uniref:Amidohydrolase-related domain-containing protein n=1 Tax=Dendrothele bispora (strain CBS 962.96) TaxID=1314807 RepID=A0A4S8M212_DENBC|nr:hypothetical protein K435DRAFT_966103 [Dendrothele bispora CBS 962.96]